MSKSAASIRRSIKEIDESRTRAHRMDEIRGKWASGPRHIDMTLSGKVLRWFRSESEPKTLQLTEEEQGELREWLEKKADSLRVHADIVEERLVGE